MARKSKCPGDRRCHLGGDIECINGVRIDVDVYTEGWERDAIYPPGPCHPKFCRACNGTGEAKASHPTDDCPKCMGTGYRGGDCDAQQRLAATIIDDDDLQETAV